MTTYETTVTRNLRGELEAKTVIPFGYDSRELHITTHKASRGGILASAQAWIRGDDGSLSCALFEDFNKRLLTTAVRCTEKAMRSLHAQALEDIAAVLAEAKAKHPPKAATTRDTLTDDVGPTAHIDPPMPDWLDDFNNPGSRHHY